MHNTHKPSGYLNSPAKVVATTAAVVFAIELLIMLALSLHSESGQFDQWDLLDPILLTLLLSPALYWLVYQPLQRQQAALERRRAALALCQSTGVSTPPEQLQALPDWPALDAPAVSGAALDALIDERPEVRAARARVESAQATLDGSNALKKSDITWGASYDHYPGTSTALIELRMQMPLQWGYSYQGEIARAASQLSQAQDALEKIRRQARADLERLRQEVLSSAERARAYEKDILPGARRVAESAELAYRKGALSLTDLLDARRTLRATLLDGLAARADHAKAATAWRLRTQPETLADVR